jgi:thermostable 8-oxoguanine DNA glycosylase
MIDPNFVHHYSSKKSVKEEFLLFCFSVAGKTAVIQAQKLDLFLKNLKELYGDDLLPFQLIQKAVKNHVLRENLEQVKIGQYKRLEHAFSEVSFLDVETVSLEQLESISGIGPKTARFFLLYTRKNSKYAVLDTHILKWMKRTFPEIDIPKSTPTLKKYYQLETVFLNYCKENDLNPEDIDLEIWKSKGQL